MTRNIAPILSTTLTLALTWLTTPAAHAQSRQQLLRENRQLKQQLAALTTEKATVTAQNSGLRDQLTAARAGEAAALERAAQAEAREAEATTERDTARLEAAAALSRLTLAEAAQARLVTVNDQLQGQVTARVQELAAAAVRESELTQRVAFLEANQPPADVGQLLADYHAAIDRNLAWREHDAEDHDLIASLEAVIADFDVRTQLLRDRVETAERDALPNRELAARVATLEMQLTEAERARVPEPDEVVRRREVEYQQAASLRDFVTQRHPTVLQEWEQEETFQIPPVEEPQ